MKELRYIEITTYRCYIRTSNKVIFYLKIYDELYLINIIYNNICLKYLIYKIFLIRDISDV